MRKIPIVFAADYNYAFPVSVAIISLLENKENNTFYDIYILAPDIFPKNVRKIFKDLHSFYSGFRIDFVLVEEEVFVKAKVISSYITLATYYRLLIPELITDYDKCIYLDCDTIIECDLSELYQTDIEQYYMAAVKEYGGIKEAREAHRVQIGIPSMDEYVNAGMLLMNLVKMKEDNIVNVMLPLMEKGFIAGDQDALNIACYGKIKLLPIRYNLFERYYLHKKLLLRDNVPSHEVAEAEKEKGIIHFAGGNMKPWYNLRTEGSNIWWMYADRLPANELYAQYMDAAVQWCNCLRWEYILNKCESFKDIIIFGFSDIGRDLFDYLTVNGIHNIACFCDNDKCKQGQEYKNVKVMDFKSLTDISTDILFINSSQIYYKEIQAQMTDAGVREKNIVRYIRKSKIYYMALKEEYYNEELNEANRKVFGISQDHENIREEMIEKFWMDCWILYHDMDDSQPCRKDNEWGKT